MATTSSALGHVASLFPHIEKEWWRYIFDEFYLRTDGDVLDDKQVAEAECLEMLALPHLAHLFERSKIPGSAQIKVLDLCCGQGRHSIWLAEKYPSVSFHGLDSSPYLIDLARKRATGFENVTFFEGTANSLPVDSQFDMIMIMGNSFGYNDKASDSALLVQVHDALKPGGFFIVDIPDSDWMRQSIKDRSWEWIDDRDGELLASEQVAEMGVMGSKMLACRERELNKESNTMAVREIILDLSRGVVRDNFYSFRLYSTLEMDEMLIKAGLAVHPVARLEKPKSTRNQDLGAMEQRHIIMAQKPDFTNALLSGLDDTVDYFVHPNLSVRSVQHKGRQVIATDSIPAGTLLLAAKPYALVPSVDPSRGDYYFCSSFDCSRRVLKSTAEVVACACIEDVVWCNEACRAQDSMRHTLECEWLKLHTEDLLKQYGTYDFNMLWLIVRVLCRRRLDTQGKSAALFPAHDGSVQSVVSDVDEFCVQDPISWQSICDLLENQEKFPPDTLRHWTVLVKAYLTNSTLAASLSTSDIVGLICKEETNSFCLYPKATGIYPHVEKVGNRGIPYGLAIHTRASFFNHSCLPNAMHGPDEVGRMVIQSTRAIAAGEECCIAYFDLEERSTLEARRELLTKFFNFTCDCRRCFWESGL